MLLVHICLPFDATLERCEEETAYAQAVAAKLGGVAFRPYLWYLPQYEESGIAPHTAFAALGYCGFKLHPRAQQWNFAHPAHNAALHEIFQISAEAGALVLIHTGGSPFERPGRFAPYLRQYGGAHVILAHCRPAADTAAMLRQFPGLRADISFAPAEAIAQLRAAGLSGRLVFGTDFPATHYWHQQEHPEPLGLAEQYRADCAAAAYLP